MRLAKRIRWPRALNACQERKPKINRITFARVLVESLSGQIRSRKVVVLPRDRGCAPGGEVGLEAALA